MAEIRVGMMRRDKGVNVARPSSLGNPFVIGPHGTRDEVIEKYAEWIEPHTQWTGPQYAALNRLEALARQGDLTLLCWCRTVEQNEPGCHADVIADILRERLAPASGENGTEEAQA